MTSKLSRPVLWLGLLLTALAPYKFGNLIGVPEADPSTPWLPIEWMFSVWPSMLFAAGAGVWLALTLLTYFPGRVRWQEALWINAGLWSLTVLTGLLGFIRATTWDFPVAEMIHLGGALAYLLGITLILSREPERSWHFIGALTAGMLLVLWDGVYQFLWGTEEMRHYLERQEAQGVVFPEEMRARMLDNRLKGGFTSCNSLAGFLLLAGPPVLLAIWRWAGRFEPARLSRPLFTGLIGAVWLGVFLGTKSRAAFLALAVGVVIYAFVWLASRKLRIALALAALAVIVAGGVYIGVAGRGFGSMTVRVDYYAVGAKLLAQHPLTGAGWGEFFHNYMAMKVFDIDESSHDPHSMLMSMASQCGIAGGLAILGAMAFVLYAGWRMARRYPEEKIRRALWFGLLMFFIHGMVELHLQAVATLAPALALSAILLVRGRPEDAVPLPESGILARWSFVIAAALLAGLTIGGGVYWVRSEYAYAELCAAVEGQTSAIQAEEVFRRAAAARPGSPFPYQQMADYYWRRRNVTQAEKYYREASERSPERAMYYARLSELRRLQGDIEGARAFGAEALKRDPANAKYRQMSE